MTVCQRGVLWKDSVANWTANSLLNIRKLREGIYGGWYHLDNYITFFVFEPKTRKIVSTRFKDRVFQRSLCDNYFYNEITKHFIYDNAACQKNRGTDFCRKRFKIHLQEAYREYGPLCELLKCDIHDYFGSTQHCDADASVRKRVPDEWVCDQVETIIKSFNQGPDPDVGMGLGSEVTQLVELSVLDDMDHYIKEILGIKHYVRYNDDFILIHPDHSYLLHCKEQIQRLLAEKHLELSPKKTKIQKITQRVRFLGFSFEVKKNARVIMRITQENIKHERRRLRKLVQRAEDGYMTRKQVDECYKSYTSYLDKGNNYNERLKMDAYYKDLRKEYYHHGKGKND